MPLDPAVPALIAWMDEQGLGNSHDTPEAARAAMDAITGDPNLPKPPVHAVENRAIPGPGGEIPVRVYRPSDASALPMLVWLHGGGWVTGNLDTHDQLCRLLCGEVGALVVSVDYRLAPEAKFPAAVDDCVAAWTWINDHATELGGDPARVALGGDSAGGNLAAVTALSARDQGLPAPILQLLVYPVTDYETDSASMIDNAKGYFLETERMEWFWNHYATNPDDFADWRMSPLRAPDVSTLPRAVVVTAEYDPLRDQGNAYAERLAAAGIATQHVCVDGLFHGFYGMHPFLPAAQPAWDMSVDALRVAFKEAIA